MGGKVEKKVGKDVVCEFDDLDSRRFEEQIGVLVRCSYGYIRQVFQ